MRTINFKATEYFEAAARLGSMTRAAGELGVSPSAVSQQIRLLETQYGVKLFRRERKRLILTLDGDRLFQTTTQAFAALRNARNAIGRKPNPRSLTLRVSPSFGVRWLGSRIARFAGDNPEWNIRIDATPDFTAFDTEAIDFDLRYGLGEWAGLTNDCVMHDAVLPLCSPAYLERWRAVADPASRLREARLIDSVKALYRWELWLAANGAFLPELDYPFRFDRSSMSIEMAKQGGGVALDSAMLCRNELESGELVPFAKAYSGLDDKEINTLDKWIRRHTLERFGPVRSVEQQQVFELAFEGIQLSTRHKSGVAVRFPRILRWRHDLGPKDADSLEDVKRLIAPEVTDRAGTPDTAGTGKAGDPGAGPDAVS